MAKSLYSRPAILYMQNVVAKMQAKIVVPLCREHVFAEIKPATHSRMISV